MLNLSIFTGKTLFYSQQKHKYSVNDKDGIEVNQFKFDSIDEKVDHVLSRSKEGYILVNIYRKRYL